MAEDPFKFRIDTKPLLDSFKQLDKDTNRATMFALRAVGRKVKQESRRRAPVYGGRIKSMSINSRKSVRVTTGAKGAGGKREYGKSIPIVPGLLKGSISSSRSFVSHGRGEYSIKVGPRGGHVHLYAGKQENNKPYMEPARQIAEAMAPALHAAAWEKAMKKAGRL